jgi:hypothetical protein
MFLTRSTVRSLTFLLLGIAITMSALGGMIDMVGSRFYVTKEHAWMDASFLILVAILLNVMD